MSKITDEERNGLEDSVTEMYTFLINNGEEQVATFLKQLRIKDFNQWVKAMEEVKVEIAKREGTPSSKKNTSASQKRNADAPRIATAKPFSAKSQDSQPQKAKKTVDERLGNAGVKAGGTATSGAVAIVTEESLKEEFDTKYSALDQEVAITHKKLFYDRRLMHRTDTLSTTANIQVVENLSIERATDIKEDYPSLVLKLQSYLDNDLSAWYFSSSGLVLETELFNLKQELSGAITFIELQKVTLWGKVKTGISLGAKSIFLSKTKKKTLVARNTLISNIRNTKGRI